MASFSPSLNRAAALERIDGDEELYSEIVGIYLEDTPVQVEKLKAAIAAGDDEVCLRQAHSLKSASANIGAEKLRDIAYRMEQAAREGGSKAAAPLLSELLAEFQTVVSLLS